MEVEAISPWKLSCRKRLAKFRCAEVWCLNKQGTFGIEVHGFVSYECPHFLQASKQLPVPSNNKALGVKAILLVAWWSIVKKSLKMLKSSLGTIEALVPVVTLRI